MRILIQRVSRASVTVDGERVATIGRGYLALVGVTHGDSAATAGRLAAKTARLRVFEDDAGLMNLALADVGGEVLAVSQFTLYADARRGNRPSFTDAARPAQGEAVYAAFVEALRAECVPVQTGIFGAHMHVDLVNDGPVTILLEA
ncbi:MAG: D-aminoacyl-tRNA deacylase [Actinobacteria bacterium]|nr:D-aminoacyl-tRNA deacylase [Actinomycetota bacterium]